MSRLALLAPALAILVVGAAPPSAPPFHRVCGWLDNPTPGNWWLTDREREWTIATQGSDAVPGWDDIAYDPSEHPYVRTNGSYGYGCACASMQVDHRAGTVLRIRSLTARPLATCRADRRLPRR